MLERDKYQKEETLHYKITKNDRVIVEGDYIEKSHNISIPRDIRKSIPPECFYKITRPSTGEYITGFFHYSFAIDSPKFNLPRDDYRVDVSWDYVDSQLKSMAKYSGQTIEEILNPEFQRGHVWTEHQQIAYVEYILMGGKSGKEVYFNSKGWNEITNMKHPYYCVDGLQRITAVRRFMNNEFPVFDNRYLKDTTGIDIMSHSFSWHVIDFQTYDELLDWYITLNNTGTAHTMEELERVENLKGEIE